jgi:hypothetical protein
MAMISLRNGSWQNGVNVKALIGNNTVITQNASLGQRNIPYGQDWPIDAGDQDVYYCRDADPDNPNGAMTGWTIVSSAGGDQTVDV